MSRQLSRIAWSASRALILVAGLGACAMPPAYMAERLNSVPQPAAVLMVKAAVPDCRSQPARTAPSVRPRPPAREIATSPAGTDFENELRNTESPIVTQKRSELVSDTRDAEQLARQRLEALQASSAETLAALDDMRNNPPDQGQLPAW